MQIFCCKKNALTDLSSCSNFFLLKVIMLWSCVVCLYFTLLSSCTFFYAVKNPYLYTSLTIIIVTITCHDFHIIIFYVVAIAVMIIMMIIMCHDDGVGLCVCGNTAVNLHLISYPIHYHRRRFWCNSYPPKTYCN